MIIFQIILILCPFVIDGDDEFVCESKQNHQQSRDLEVGQATAFDCQSIISVDAARGWLPLSATVTREGIAMGHWLADGKLKI
jgi:hypothetical protein